MGWFGTTGCVLGFLCGLFCSGRRPVLCVLGIVGPSRGDASRATRLVGRIVFARFSAKLDMDPWRSVSASVKAGGKEILVVERTNGILILWNYLSWRELSGVRFALFCCEGDPVFFSASLKD